MQQNSKLPNTHLIITIITYVTASNITFGAVALKLRISMKLILNPEYMLKPEKGKALLLTADPFRAKNNEKLESVIHPIHAMILSFFDGKEKDLCIDNAAQYLNVDKGKISNFVSKLIKMSNL